MKKIKDLLNETKKVNEEDQPFEFKKFKGEIGFAGIGEHSVENANTSPFVEYKGTPVVSSHGSKKNDLKEEFDQKVIEKTKALISKPDKSDIDKYIEWFKDHSDNEEILGQKGFAAQSNELDKRYKHDARPHSDSHYKYTGHSRDLNHHLYQAYKEGKAPKIKAEGFNVKHMDASLGHELQHDLHVYSGSKFHPGIALKNNPDGLVHLPAYTSTSVNKGTARSFAGNFDEDGKTDSSKEQHPHIIHFHLKKGQKMGWAGGKSAHKSEHELTLPRHTTIKIHHEPHIITNSSGNKTHIWHAHIVPNELAEHQHVEPESPYKQEDYDEYVKLKKHAEYHYKKTNKHIKNEEWQSHHNDLVKKYEKLMNNSQFKKQIGDDDYESKSDAEFEAFNSPLQKDGSDYDHSIIPDKDAEPVIQGPSKEDRDEYIKLKKHLKYHQAAAYKAEQNDDNETAQWHYSKADEINQKKYNNKYANEADYEDSDEADDEAEKNPLKDEEYDHSLSSDNTPMPTPKPAYEYNNKAEGHAELLNLYQQSKYHNEKGNSEKNSVIKNKHYNKTYDISDKIDNHPLHKEFKSKKGNYYKQHPAKIEAESLPKLSSSPHDEEIYKDAPKEPIDNKKDHDEVKSLAQKAIWHGEKYLKETDPTKKPGHEKKNQEYYHKMMTHPSMAAHLSSGNFVGTHPGFKSAKSEPLTSDPEVEDEEHKTLVKLHQNNLYHYNNMQNEPSYSGAKAKLTKKWEEALADMQKHPAFIKQMNKGVAHAQQAAYKEAKKNPIDEPHADIADTVDNDTVDNEPKPKKYDTSSPSHKEIVKHFQNANYHALRYSKDGNDEDYGKMIESQKKAEEHPDFGGGSKGHWNTHPAYKEAAANLITAPHDFSEKKKPEEKSDGHKKIVSLQQHANYHATKADAVKDYYGAGAKEFDHHLNKADEYSNKVDNHPEMKSFKSKPLNAGKIHPAVHEADQNPITASHEDYVAPKKEYDANSKEHKELVSIFQHMHHHTKKYNDSPLPVNNVSHPSEIHHKEKMEKYSKKKEEHSSYQEFKKNNPGATHPANKKAISNPITSSREDYKEPPKEYDTTTKDHKELVKLQKEKILHSKLTKEEPSQENFDKKEEIYKKIESHPHTKSHPDAATKAFMHAKKEVEDDEIKETEAVAKEPKYDPTKHSELKHAYQHVHYHTNQWSAHSGVNDAKADWHDKKAHEHQKKVSSHPEYVQHAAKHGLEKLHPAEKEALKYPIIAQHKYEPENDLHHLIHSMKHHAEKINFSAAGRGFNHVKHKEHIQSAVHYHKAVEAHPDMVRHAAAGGTISDHPLYKKVYGTK